MVIAFLFGAFALAKDCDEFLMTQIQYAQGKARAFMHRSAGLAKRMAYDADDIAQEMLIAAWKALEGYDESNPGAAVYMSQKMDWVAQDIARRALTQKRNVPSVQSEFEVADTKEIEDYGDIELVRNKLGFLPRAERKHMELYLDGKTIPEIAAMCGIGETRANKSIRTSILILRRIITHEQ